MFFFSVLEEHLLQYLNLLGLLVLVFVFLEREVVLELCVVLLLDDFLVAAVGLICPLHELAIAAPTAAARDLDEPVADVANELAVERDVLGLELPEEGLGSGVIDS